MINEELQCQNHYCEAVATHIVRCDDDYGSTTHLLCWGCTDAALNRLTCPWHGDADNHYMSARELR